MAIFPTGGGDSTILEKCTTYLLQTVRELMSNGTLLTHISLSANFVALFTEVASLLN